MSAAYLLRAIDYRDADRIVTLFTEEHGKISAIARGAKRSRKRFGGALQPYLLLEARLTRARRGGDLWTLEDVRVRRPFHGILGALARIQSAGAALEFVRAITAADEPQPRLLEAIGSLFERVEASGADTCADLLLSFRMRALALAGLRPELEHCAVSGVRCPPERPALFDPALGAIVSRAHGGGPFLLDASTRARLLAALGDEWATLDAWPAHERAQAEAALEAFVRHHVRPR